MLIIKIYPVAITTIQSKNALTAFDKNQTKDLFISFYLNNDNFNHADNLSRKKPPENS